MRTYSFLGGLSAASPQGGTTTSGMVVACRVFFRRVFILVVPPWSFPCLSDESILPKGALVGVTGVLSVGRALDS
ncbi:hypothetical protein VNO78_10756 [Psophocarpus tetragonolobus]|uniref:Uncharacterized protein n=1 Tax=Psophocarpus tetragonolobus TaxID=3891 RepID=A0AAN9SL59_PSOTE